MTSVYSNIFRNNFFKAFAAGSVGVGSIWFLNQDGSKKINKGSFFSSTNGDVDPSILKKLEEAYSKLNGPEGKDCKSLLKKHLTRDTFDNLKNRKTPLGGTLLDVIQSGVANLDSSVGVYAPDPEAYNTFSELFDKIIKDYHGVDPNKKKQPPVDMDLEKCKYFKPLDPKGKYIISTRIRCGRTLNNFPFNPLLTEANYKEMEEKVRSSLESVQDPELKGTYYPLTGMTKKVQTQLIKDHFLFKEGDRFLQHANACRFWPTGRGIFHNSGKTFLVWVNEEDHLRLISMQQGSDVGAVFSRLIRGVQAIEKVVPFKRDERLGQLLFCPTNIGCSVRASVHIKLPKVSARKDFKQICENLNLQIRGIDGEHSESKGGVYDISNKARLGLSEYEAVKQMYDGVKKLIEMEEAER
uniref:arginine kinase n=1 Tax=Strongyloides stercoralis TaxID=6248 RepID=A0A0K0E8Z6_STRER